MSSLIIYAVGFIAQLLFSSRLILQWLATEKNKKIIAQRSFWEVSLLASFLLFVYGYLRHDFAIMLGQVFTYYIYIRNLQLQGEWSKRPWYIRLFVIFFPVLLLVYGYNNGEYDVQKLFSHEHIPHWLIVMGSVAQVLFTLRFVYQWLYSEKVKESVLPLGFWVLSLAGSLMIFAYALLRKDPVLLAGHIFGIIIYSRNIIILKRADATVR